MSAMTESFWSTLPLGREVVLLSHDRNGLAALAKPVEYEEVSQPEPPTPPNATLVAPKLEQSPLPGFEKDLGDDPSTVGTNVAKFTENAKIAPEKVDGMKNVPLIEGATASQPAIDPKRPQKRPSIVKQQQVRPAIFAENKFGTSNIGPVAVDAKWSNYGAYLQRMIETVQIEWDKILTESKTYPPAGSTVEVKFIMNSDGKITRIVNVETSANETASRSCMSAITERAPYGKWTDDMIAMLGQEQEMTFKFFYQ